VVYARRRVTESTEFAILTLSLRNR